MVSCRACFRASLFLLTAWFRSDTWRDRGTGHSHIGRMEKITSKNLNPKVSSNLWLVPVLRLSNVLGSNALILCSDVSQRCCQVRLGHIHLDLHLGLLHLCLQLSDLLQGQTEGSWKLKATCIWTLTPKYSMVFHEIWMWNIYTNVNERLNIKLRGTFKLQKRQVITGAPENSYSNYWKKSSNGSRYPGVYVSCIA